MVLGCRLDSWRCEWMLAGWSRDVVETCRCWLLPVHRPAEGWGRMCGRFVCPSSCLHCTPPSAVPQSYAGTFVIKSRY